MNVPKAVKPSMRERHDAARRVALLDQHVRER